ncbi:hypothetical protein SAMN05444000_106189 [Shimia gijangensis]|uniref:Uncharacterized protein n=1 Tax=Shimia gijangensis TaxID=1470563 RepID=A0A1M6HY16_9RHOB|nr:hypothetical protein [Shimia gijangensis]SHJ26987.1 hypothetical protein SAMN05444000_106189 [Shimia gijangensis]
MKKTLMLATAVSLIAVSSFAETASGRPSRAAIEEAATTMGVSSWGMGMCMRSLRKDMPLQEGEGPSPEMQAKFHNKLYACLQGKNQDLTRETFDTAMAKLPVPGQ